jgi:probable HAF family extracellular repeat protein
VEAFLTLWWQAGLAGGVLALLVALLCRVVPRLHPKIRFWAWWLVSAKLLLGLILAGRTIALAVLPTPISLPNSLAIAQPPIAQTKTIESLVKVVTPPSLVQAPIQSLQVLEPGAVQTLTPTKPASRLNFPLMTTLFFLWALGVGIGIVRYGIGGWRVYVLVRDAHPLPSYQNRRIVEGATITTPFVTGLLRPTICLPLVLTDTEQRLAVAHEFAHIKRGDLWLGLVPSMATLLFWMLPWAHRAEAQCREIREILCDQEAMQIGSVGAKTYALFLLQLQQGNSHQEAGTIGMASAGYALLRRRVQALTNGQRRPSRIASGLLGVFGLGSVLPLSLKATVINMPPVLPSRSQDAKPIWDFVPLPLNSAYSDAVALSDTGALAGSFSDKDGNGHAFRFESNNSKNNITDLGTFGRWRSAATGISADGMFMTVAAFNRSRQPSAVLVDRYQIDKYQQTPLTGPRDYPYIQPLAVAQNGTVVGSVRQGERPQGAVRAHAVQIVNRKTLDIGTLGGDNAHALGISADARFIVGKADTADGRTHAFLYKNGPNTMQDLGTLGGAHSRANAVNTMGQVVGMSRDSEENEQAFLYENAQMQALPNGEAEKSAALSINEKGEIAGWTETNGVRTAALWRQQAGSSTYVLTDANVLLSPLSASLPSGWHLETIRAINRHGDLCGQGIQNGQRQAFLLRRVDAS